ncbi:MAG TPA: hypothetical protein VJH25_02280 [Candidatus Paceibacterota bacterium]
MDPQFKTSFIPKKPIVVPAGGYHAPSTINLFSLLAMTLFIIALVLSGAVFFYKSLLTKQIESNKATLERAKGAFDPELIERIIRLDTRIETSKKLLSDHLALSPFFDFLSTVTLRTIRFKDFSFSYLSKDKIKLEMKGQAESYAGIALESDLLNSQKYLRDTVVSDMALEPSGLVSFKVSATIDPSLISYSATIADENLIGDEDSLDSLLGETDVTATSSAENMTGTTTQP